jgi:thiol-disulfide isomerase/thioredoxin
MGYATFEDAIKGLKTFCLTCLAEHPHLERWEAMAFTDDLETIDRWQRHHNDEDGFVLATILLSQVQQVAKSKRQRRANDPDFIYESAVAVFGYEFDVYYKGLQVKHGTEWAFREKAERTKRLISKAQAQGIPIPSRLKGRKEFGT